MVNALIQITNRNYDEDWSLISVDWKPLLVYDTCAYIETIEIERQFLAEHYEELITNTKEHMAPYVMTVLLDNDYNPIQAERKWLLYEEDDIDYDSIEWDDKVTLYVAMGLYSNLIEC